MMLEKARQSAMTLMQVIKVLSSTRQVTTHITLITDTDDAEKKALNSKPIILMMREIQALSRLL
jgi:hypothetical protein